MLERTEAKPSARASSYLSPACPNPSGFSGLVTGDIGGGGESAALKCCSPCARARGGDCGAAMRDGSEAECRMPPRDERREPVTAAAHGEAQRMNE